MLLFNYDGSLKFDTKIEFQNISCYCLTERITASRSECKSFQNISCYCLTNRSVYAKIFKAISKHLMLLFNSTTKPSALSTNIFQNISCYCLTYIFTSPHNHKSISKHLMLLFNWIRENIDMY